MGRADRIRKTSDRYTQAMAKGDDKGAAQAMRDREKGGAITRAAPDGVWVVADNLDDE